MRTYVSGEIVEIEKKPYDFNGRSGITYAVYYREEGKSARDGAQKIKVQPEQFGTFKVGDRLTFAPVDVYPRNSDFGGAPRLDVNLDRDYVHATGLHAAPAPAKVG